MAATVHTNDPYLLEAREIRARLSEEWGSPAVAVKVRAGDYDTYPETIAIRDYFASRPVTVPDTHVLVKRMTEEEARHAISLSCNAGDDLYAPFIRWCRNHSIIRPEPTPLEKARAIAPTLSDDELEAIMQLGKLYPL